MKTIKKILLALLYPFYFFFWGTKHGLIDCENQRLARKGINKVCYDFEWKNEKYVTGNGTRVYLYVDGDPSKAPKRLIGFFEFINKLEIAE